MANLRIETKHAIAFRLAGLLEQYEEDVLRFRANSSDPKLLQVVEAEMGLIKQYAGSVAELSVPYLELFVSHMELVASSGDGSTPGPIAAVPPTASHLARIAQLRSFCIALISTADGSTRTDNAPADDLPAQGTSA